MMTRYYSDDIVGLPEMGIVARTLYETAEVGPDDMRFPNGSVITPDGGTLIVGQTFGGDYVAFTIGDDGRLRGRRRWAAIEGTAPTAFSGNYGWGAIVEIGVVPAEQIPWASGCRMASGVGHRAAGVAGTKATRKRNENGHTKTRLARELAGEAGTATGRGKPLESEHKHQTLTDCRRRSWH